ncbi:MAG TPA: DUF3159 domain-containing protein [Streptosporangiales bacterium]
MPRAERGSGAASPPEAADAPEPAAPEPMSADEQRRSLLAAVGGGRGAVETSLPGLVFVTVFAIWHDLRVGAVVAGALGVVLLVIRIVRKETTQYAIGGFVGVVIAALFAVSTGKAANYFLPSILKNLGFALLYLVSVIVRWPLLGVLLGPLLKENFAWRRHDARRRAYAQATLIWTGMFAVRLAVMLPLYLLDETVALGVAGVVLSWPLFAVVAWSTWLVIRRVPPVPAAAASAE